MPGKRTGRRFVASLAATAAALLLSSCAGRWVVPEAWRTGARPTPSVTEYYLEVAFGSEFGDNAYRIRTWGSELKLRIWGNADEADSAEVDRVLRELNELAGREMIRRADAGENVEVRFTDRAELDRNVPPEARGSTGYVQVWWNGSYTIYRAKVFIRTDGIPRKRRRHVIREEITQGLGLLNDSWAQPDSIFYQGYSDVTEYSSLDRAVIRLHLQNRALTGITQAQFRELLASPRFE